MSQPMFKTSTPVGREGFNISYSDEMKCAKSLDLPEGWAVKFDWAQILFSDVQYEIDVDKKEVSVVYNRNLSQWWQLVKTEIEDKMKVVLS